MLRKNILSHHLGNIMSNPKHLDKERYFFLAILCHG
jgi:hypothetical protein